MLTAENPPIVRRKLDHLVWVSPSGLGHDWYSVDPIALDDAVMHARFTSYPPLDQVTVVEPGKTSVAFTVALEAEEQNVPWDVQIWHNASNSSEWEGLPLNLQKQSPFQVSVATQNGHAFSHFNAVLPSKFSPPRPVSFTVRFRLQGETSWKWVRDQAGTDDGQLLFSSSVQSVKAKDDLATYFDHISPGLSVQHVASDTPNTTLWSVTAKAAPAQGERSGYSDHFLGQPKDYLRWFSLVRLWSPWIAPRQGQGYPFADKDGVMYSFLRTDGLHVVALAISGVEDVLTVFRHEDGKLKLCARNDRQEEGVARVVVAVGQTFEEANAAVIYKARHIVSPYSPVSEQDRQVVQKLEEESEGVHASWIQDWYDGFTYCTWNGLGQNLTEEKIMTALNSLEKRGIRITNLIIDDNWQSLDNEGENQFKRGWTEFEANQKGFPQGLKVAITNIRQKYPDIQHIAVWHALLGYWGGISPTGKIAQNYKTVQVQVRPGGPLPKSMTVVDATDVKRLYDDFYTFLLSAGIDAVKTDAQFMVDEIDNSSARRNLTSTYLQTWTSAQLRHFSAHAISCMSQTPSILFPCQLPNTTPAIPVRNSDDFFPDIEESHTWHIFTNAHAALLTQHLNVLPDWDMFQTDHRWASFHASARAISGGPIYVTDEPGRHNVGLIAQMTAQTRRGQTVILRPSVVARSTQQYVGFEEERLLKVAAYDGDSSTGTSFLGLWNCRPERASEFVCLSDFRGVGPSDRPWIVRSHRSGACALARWDAGGGEPDVFMFALGGHEWELLSVRRVEGPFSLVEGGDPLLVSNLGLVGKMTGAVAIVREDISVRPREAQPDVTPFSPFSRRPAAEAGAARTRLRWAVTLKALGVLGLWVGKKVDVQGDLFVLLEGRPVPVEFVSLGGVEDGVVKIDIEGAWKEMRLEGGYSNEVDVVVFIS